jgi:transcriptional regulator with XRE-family HTH domain
MDDYRKDAGQRLLRLREAANLTQEDLAAKARVAVKTVSRFENGHHDGRRSTIQKLAKALGVTELDITGPPPAPLGLGYQGESQLDRVEREVARLHARLDTLGVKADEGADDDAPLRSEVAGVLASGGSPPARPRGRRRTARTDSK